MKTGKIIFWTSIVLLAGTAAFVTVKYVIKE